MTAITNEGFLISALQMVRLTRTQAEEFLEVYDEVLKEYPVSRQPRCTRPVFSQF